MFNKNFLTITAITLCVIFTQTNLTYAQVTDAWQLYQTIHPTDQLLVAVHIDQASGQAVDKTGGTDVTSAFQIAIDRVFNAGGGAIYVPAGSYRFDGSIIVKEGVSIRGDFVVPDEVTPEAELP